MNSDLEKKLYADNENEKRTEIEILSSFTIESTKAKKKRSTHAIHRQEEVQTNQENSGDTNTQTPYMYDVPTEFFQQHFQIHAQNYILLLLLLLLRCCRHFL